MGAWGAGSFENDHAMDWVISLLEGSGDTIPREALAPITATEDRFLQAPDCSIAIAAAEAIAAARGYPAVALPAEIADWVRTKPIVPPEMATLAKAAVDRVARESELKALWDESDAADDWRLAMSDLRKRLA